MTKACALIGPFRGGPEKDPSWGRIFFGVGVSTVWGFRSISYFGDSLRKGQTKKFKGGGWNFWLFLHCAPWKGSVASQNGQLCLGLPRDLPHSSSNILVSALTENSIASIFSWSNIFFKLLWLSGTSGQADSHYNKPQCSGQTLLCFRPPLTPSLSSASNWAKIDSTKT